MFFYRKIKHIKYVLNNYGLNCRGTAGAHDFTAGVRAPADRTAHLGAATCQQTYQFIFFSLH